MLRKKRAGLCETRNSRLWIRCDGRSLRDWHSLFLFLSLRIVTKYKSGCQSKTCRLFQQLNVIEIHKIFIF